MMAHATGLEPGDFVHTFGDVHLYNNHLEQARLQLSREPRALPSLKIRQPRNSIVDFEYDDFELLDYTPHPHIAAPVAV